MREKPKTVTGDDDGPLSEFVRQYRAQPENEFDALPPDQQIVRLKNTVAYLSRRCAQAEEALVIANTTAQNLHAEIAKMQRCASCDGRGVVGGYEQIDYGVFTGSQATDVPCLDCTGTGRRLPEAPCPD